MVAIVDYDAGNIKSVEKALQYIGEHPVITRDVKEIKKADHVIVPLVGALYRISRVFVLKNKRAFTSSR